MPAPTKPYQPYAELHKNPQGAGDGRPTALQIIKDEELLGDGLKGKVFLITGCSSGIGVETARALHAAGADVYITVRPNKKSEGQQIISSIKASTHSPSKLELILMDLSSFTSIRSGAFDFLSKSPTLNCLIANAGVMMCPYSKTIEGFENQIGTNHVGHFLLFQLLKNRLLSSATPENASRVVMVTSAGHRFSPIRFDDLNFEKEEYDRMKAYGQSKTANIYTSSCINRHYSHLNLTSTSVHPGVILSSQLIRHQTSQSLDTDFDLQAMLPYVKDLEQGAATQVWAAVSKWFNDKGGVYLGDCGEAGPAREGEHLVVPGWVRHTYDEEAEERLWRVSCEAVGVACE